MKALYIVKRKKEKMITLSKDVKALWGKKKVDNGQQMWLPLIAHMIDTKNVIGWLYNHWLSEGQRKLLLVDNSEEETQNLIEFLGYIHDIGKATPAFQTRESYIHDDELDQALVENLVRNGFENLDNIKLASSNKSPHNVAGEAILENNGLNKSVAAIVGAHHGKPENKAPEKSQFCNYMSNYYQTQQKSDYQTHWKKVQQELIEYGLELTNFKSLENIPKVSQTQAVLLTGLVIMADWMASSEYLGDPSKPMFPLIRMDQNFEDLDVTARYKKGIRAWKNEEIWNPERIVDIAGNYQKRWNFEPRPVQQVMSDSIGKAIDPGIIIIEAPMGIGKTEIALTATEQLAFRSQKTGLYFGLPTQATTNAMFSRVDGWLQSISAEQNKNLSINLMHSKAKFNEEYRKLPRAENIDESEDNNGTVTVNSWFTGKKSILEEFTVGTIDNLLLMGLKQRHLFLKHLGFSGKVVVIDEVHAYDVYMSSYLDKALEWLGAYHVPVVVLSATLPKKRRNELLQAYSIGKFGSKKFIANNDWENNQSYPLMSMLDGQNLVQVSNFEKIKDKRVTIHRIDDDANNVVNLALDKIKNGGIVGIVVNTIKRAQEISSLIPKEVNHIVLHSSYLAPDRAKLENKLQKMIGKDGQRPEKLIVIGTQVLEQSLDIDFDVLFSDIAPIDLIFQRVGRLHRHDISRPDDLKKPELYVMGAEHFGNYGDANEAIYEKYLLMKTDQVLKDHITLPQDISPLVQSVYDFNQDENISGIAEAKEQFMDDYKLSKRKAKTFQISKPRPLDTIHGWLDREQLGLDKDEIKAQAAVRDIKETVEVILLQEKDNEFYLINGEKVSDLPSYARDKIIAEQVIRLPSALTLNINSAIDQLETITSQHFPDWQKSVWLKGDVALILDENMTTSFNGWKITYSSDLGLNYEKED